jgi:hypothetical protein
MQKQWLLCGAILLGFTMGLARPAAGGDRGAREEAKDPTKPMSSHEVSEWVERNERRYRKDLLWNVAKACRGRRDLMDYFLRLYDEKQPAGEIAWSIQAFKGDMDEIRTFWGRVTDKNWGMKIGDAKRLYQALGGRKDLVALAFRYWQQAQYKKVDVTPGEIAGLFRACKGDENLITFYFEMRINEEKPRRECVAALKEKVVGKRPKPEEGGAKEAEETGKSPAPEEKPKPKGEEPEEPKEPAEAAPKEEEGKEDPFEGAKPKHGEEGPPKEEEKPDKVEGEEKKEEKKPPEDDVLIFE